MGVVVVGGAAVIRDPFPPIDWGVMNVACWDLRGGGVGEFLFRALKKLIKYSLRPHPEAV